MALSREAKQLVNPGRGADNRWPGRSRLSTERARAMVECGGFPHQPALRGGYFTRMGLIFLLDTQRRLQGAR
jgi:hypothetical protein